MYVYKLTLTNGKSYIIKSLESNVKQFANSCSKVNTITDFSLNEEYTEDGVRFNTILIRTDNVVSIEYMTKLN